MEDIILIGYGGHARSVADCIKRNRRFRIAGYTEWEPQDCEYPYLGTDDELGKIYQRGILNAVICIGYLGKGKIREKLYRTLKKIGYRFPVICDPSAIISDTAVLEEGSFVGKGAVVNSGARIGRECIVNTMALVEHDCVVKDFAHIAVGVVLCGGVLVGEGAFVGAGATVIQGLSIPDRGIVPAGMTVRKGNIMDGLVKKRGGGVLIESLLFERVWESISQLLGGGVKWGIKKNYILLELVVLEERQHGWLSESMEGCRNGI